MKKATHSGHCQLCGNLQKMPNNRLSKHGYTVEHGYFSGVCRGAGHLAFETSFALVLDEIANAEAALKELRAEQEKLRTEIDADTRMWVHTFVPAGTAGRKRSGYIWEHVTLTAAFNDRRSVDYRYVQFGGKIVDHMRSGFHGVQPWEAKDATLEEMRRMTVLKYNNTFADWREHQVDSLVRYIAWHRSRIVGWTEKPLLPVETPDDKAGFVPKIAPY
jgi:hypothetical protein